MTKAKKLSVLKKLLTHYIGCLNDTVKHMNGGTVWCEGLCVMISNDESYSLFKNEDLKIEDIPELMKQKPKSFTNGCYSYSYWWKLDTKSGVKSRINAINKAIVLLK